MAQVQFPNIDPVLPKGELYVVKRNEDRTEGLGREIDVSFWDNLDEAVEAARRIDVQGGDGTVFRITQLLPEKRVMYHGRKYDWDNKRYITGFTVASGRGTL